MLVTSPGATLWYKLIVPDHVKQVCKSMLTPLRRVLQERGRTAACSSSVSGWLWLPSLLMAALIGLAAVSASFTGGCARMLMLF
jgi:hypothetical protein